MRPERHCLQRLRHSYHKLSVAEQKVANYILEKPVEALNSSVQQLADVCGTSTSTIIRLAKDIGFDGVKSMKIALAQEIGTLIPRLFEGSDEMQSDDYVADLMDNTVISLQQTAVQLDRKQLEAAIHKVRHAARVDVYGAGSSYIVATDLVDKLKRLGIYASTYSNSYMQAISAISLGSPDVAIAISYSGETMDTVEALSLARGQGATTIALVNFPQSTLGDRADIVLQTSVDQHLIPDGSMGGRMAQMLLVDALFMGLLLRYPDRFQQAYDRYNRVLLTKMRRGSAPTPDLEWAGDSR